MIVNTYNKNKGFFYNYGKAAINNIELGQARTFQLKNQLMLNNIKNKDLSVIYKYVDPTDMLDNATRTGGHSTKVQHTYRPLNEECAACAYSFCKDICAAAENKYSAYKLLRVYQTEARARSGFLKDKNGQDRFTSSFGKKYPQWDYHAAALLVFEESGGLSFVVIDTILEQEPVSYEHWLGLFDKNTTKFRITPFIRNKETEASIIKTSEMPPSYKPHNIRK